MDRVRGSKAIIDRTQKLADNLIKNALDSNIKRDYVVSDVEFYQAAKNLMQTHSYKAFSIDFFEVCASRLSEK